MKTLTSVALAGTIALTAITAASTGASAGKWKPRHQQHYSHNYYGPGPGAIAGAAIFGLALGALAAPMFQPAPYPYAYYPPAPPPLYPSYAYSPHAAWCSQQYVSYNPATNTWVDFYGTVRICVSPY